MKRITRLLLTFPVVLFPYACVDRDPVDPTAEIAPQAALSPVPGLHFLSPLGKGTSTAGFLGFLSPEVTVCKWASDHCLNGSTLAHFTMTSGTDDATIQLSPDGNNIYYVDWNTSETEDDVVLGDIYQVVVQVGGKLLGTADIALYRNSVHAKKAGSTALALLNGRTLPIRFGIELAALGGIQIEGENYLLKTFSTAGGEDQTALLDNQAVFQVDGTDIQIPGGGTAFTLVIYEQPTAENGECVASYPGPNAGGCYVFETVPANVTFYENGNPAIPAGIAGVCPDPDRVTSLYRLAKDDEGLTTFPAEAGLELECGVENPELTGVPRILRGLARLILPRPLHATDLGETGTVGAFSTFFWAVPLAIDENPADPLPRGPFTPGEVLSLSFRVVADHNYDEDGNPLETVTPVDGVAVEFSASGGSLSAPTAVSNLLGVVTVNWTLPASADGTLTVGVPGGLNDDNQPVTFEFDLTPAELIVWNDVNTFDEIAMDDPNNVALVQNLVNFTGSGSRAAGTKVLLDRGRSSAIGGLVEAAFEAVLTGAGFTIVSITSSASEPITSIDGAVKVAFLIGPQADFTTPEVNTLKQFAADGGRIVFIGEHAGFSAAILSVQNNLLTNMGSAASNIAGELDCGYHQAAPGQLGSHQITTGLSGVTYACMSALSLGPNDVALLEDNGLDNEADPSQPEGRSGPCAGDCVLAAATRISTTPVASILAGSSAAAGFKPTSSVDPNAVYDLTVSGVRRR